ncbi:MAG: hypothetical protein AAFN10_16100 [Bacteroidota bacterium]
MEYRNDWDAWIQAYLDGELNPEQIEVFQQQLTDSEPFAVRLKEYQESVLQIKAVQLQHLRTEMVDWVANSADNGSNNIRPLIWLASAAMIVLLAMAGSWYFLDQQYSAEALLSSNMDYRVDKEEMRNNSAANEALIAFRDQDFAIAIELLPDWENQDGQTTPKAYLYLAKAHIGLSQYDSAAYYLKLLEQLDQSTPKEMIFWQEIPWYQALVALGQNRREEALFKLEKVINNQGIHLTAAIALKAKLESSWYQRFN